MVGVVGWHGGCGLFYSERCSVPSYSLSVKHAMLVIESPSNGIIGHVELSL